MRLQFLLQQLSWLTIISICVSGSLRSHAQQQSRQVRQEPRVADSRRSSLPPGPLPAPFELTREEQQEVDRILKVWEQKTKHIHRFRCGFHRWEYQPQWAKQTWAKGVARAISEGVIHHQTPDKANFQVTSYVVLDGKGADGKPAYRREKHLEHWICDGKKIYEYEPRQKHVIERRLPAEWQGKNIIEGPLPFLFGAKAESLKQRYWIRKQPPKIENEIWLNIYPRDRQNAVNFRSVQVMLDANSFLPNGMIIVRHDESTMTFKFFDREANARRRIPKLEDLWNGTYRPRIPNDWKLVVEDGSATPSQQKRRLIPR